MYFPICFNFSAQIDSSKELALILDNLIKMLSWLTKSRGILMNSGEETLDSI